MKITARAFLCALLCSTATLLAAQSPNLLISYDKSDSLFVCGVDTFMVTIQNNGGALAANATLNIALPNGLFYAAGTVMGATQLNISNLQSPVFSLSAIPAGGNAVIELLLTADCVAATVLDTGGLFPAIISVNAPNASASVTTSSIPVETGLLLIESVDAFLMSGERFDTLYRTICVTNTRLGKIGNLHFEDFHLPGFEISVAGSLAPTNTADFYATDFDANFFTTTGNGDGWLDKNESVCFTEKIIITDCGIPEFLNTSLLRVGWGCGPTLCRFDSVYANISIKPSTKVPDLLFTQIWNPPTDNCALTGATMGLKIKNQGRGDADNIAIKVEMADLFDKMAMDGSTFRIIGSDGSISPLIPNLSTPALLAGCTAQVASSVSVTIPFIASMDSLELLFEVLNCVETCRQELPLLYVEFFYRKPCPIVNGFVSDTLIIAPDITYQIASDIELNIGACLESGQSYPALFKVRSKRLTGPTGFLSLEFELPHGVSFDTTCGTLLGGIEAVVSTTSPGPAGGLLLHLSYALPLPADSLSMNFCLHYDCDTNLVCEDPPALQNGTEIIYAADCIPCFSQLKERTYWTPSLNTPYPCAIGDCNDIFLALDASCGNNNPGGGPVDTTNMAPAFPLGYRWKMDVQRTNFGLRDMENNRIADDGSRALAQEIRLDRYLPGDTSRVTYCGYMDSSVLDTPIIVIPRIIWHEALKSDVGAPWDNDNFATDPLRNKFTNAQNLRFIHDSLRIHYANGLSIAFALDDLLATDDKNSVAVYSVNANPPAIVDVIVSQRHFFRISLPELFAQGLLPKPTLNAGDSIFFYTDFKMDMNYNTLEPGKKDPPLLGFRTAVDHGGTKYAWNFHPFKRLQYSGFIARHTPNTFSIKPCENSLEAKKFRYSLRIARENLFPFEVRPLAKITNYGQTKPEALTVVSTKLQYLALQDSTIRFSNITLPFSQLPGSFQVNFAPAFAQPIDEGFLLGANVVFGPNCSFAYPDSSVQWFSTQYRDCLNGAFPLVSDTFLNNIGFFSNHPELSIVTIDSVVYSPTRPFEVNFNLKNPVVSPAAHPWLTVQSATGLATDFQLFNMPQNQAIIPQNGIFNLAQINGFSQDTFRLTGQNISCETDSLLLIFGWDCGPISNLSQSSCYRDSYLVRLNLDRPELELDIEPEPTSITLCDTSDYFEFEIYNAKIGYTYDLFGSVKLPVGLRIVSGSSQLFYAPVGVWDDINDPESLPGGLFRWNVSESQDFIKINGLPGSNLLPPQNSVRIRFRTLAECGFVANTPIIYGAYGKEPCGRATNVLNKPGERLNIQGLSTPYGVEIDLKPVGNQASVCGATQTFAVQITMLGTPSLGDSAVVLLPQGASFVAGSYLPGQNAPTAQPTLTNTGFRVPLPILVGGGNFQFSFTVAYGPGSGCMDQIISVKTLVRTEAFCQSLGAPCAVYFSTGEFNLPLQVQHPELAIGAVETTLNGVQAGVSININNIGTYLAAGAIAQIWQDLDGNQALSVGDILLQTLQSNQIISPGGSIVISGILGNNMIPWCDLLIVLPAAENCACSDVFLPLETLAITHNPLVFCTLNAVEIGVDSLDGFNYQWQSNPGILCNTCASTLFTPDPNTPAGQMQTLLLEESSAGCTLMHEFVVTFGASAAIAVNNAIICAGQAVTLIASPPGASYAWQGPGIQMPGNPVQVLYPLDNATYQLTVTLASNCTATASVTVTVLPTDTVMLPIILACEGDTIKVFGKDTLAVAGLYHISVPNVHGCDSTTLQPVAVLLKSFVEESITFCAGDTLLIFDTVAVTVSTNMCRTYTAANTCDSTHCIDAVALTPPDLPEQDTIFSQFGAALELGGILGYASYAWTPAPMPPCLNCSTIQISTDSAGTFEYLLTVKNSEGCSDTLRWRVVVFPPCDPVKVSIPNAFTPNGDGSNDVFRPVVFESGELIAKLTIYNRWGEKVYENTRDVFWDGTSDGKAASSDVYIYIIEIECNGEKVPRYGEVTLIR